MGFWIMPYCGNIFFAALGVCACGGFAGDNIYSCSGQVTDKSSGWTFIPSKNPGGQTYNAAEGYYPDKGGQLLGPAVPADKNEFAFYMLSFTAKAAANCYWGVYFYGADGKALVPDIYSNIYGAPDKQSYCQLFYGREGAVSMRPFFQSVKGVEVWDVSLKTVSAAGAAEWCDALCKTLPPLSYSPPAGRLRLLPKTLDAMRTGRPWRVVALGDSIINDTFNSNFQALLKRDYPKSDLRFICSVRGSTGCWYYQDQEQFKVYVTDLKPDLLIIGGISHRKDIDAIRKVIEMAKKETSAEIMLMSGPFGDDWRAHDNDKPDAPLPAQTWPSDSFPAAQRALAKELGVEFIDMAGIWGAYLGASGKPFEWFNRDRVHANDRGKQIAARIIESYFKTPEK
jgi:hypothetical protein